MLWNYTTLRKGMCYGVTCNTVHVCSSWYSVEQLTSFAVFHITLKSKIKP